MRRRLILISLLLLVTLAVDCVMPWSSVMDAVLFAQAVLLAVWAGLARGPLPWRLSGMIAGIALCNIRCLIHPFNPTYPFNDFRFEIALLTKVLSVQVVHIVAILMVARCCGVGLELCPNEGSHESSDPAEPRYQFSLGYLLWWTTGLAVLLSMVRCITLYAKDYEYMHEIFVSFWRGGEAPMLISIGLIALAAVWTALGNRWLVLRVILLVSAVATAAAVEIWAIAQSSLPASPFFYLTQWRDSVTFSHLPLAAWVVGSLLVFRVAGYRIVERRPVRPSPPTPTESPPPRSERE